MPVCRCGGHGDRGGVGLFDVSRTLVDPIEQTLTTLPIGTEFCYDADDQAEGTAARETQSASSSRLVRSIVSESTEHSLAFATAAFGLKRMATSTARAAISPATMRLVPQNSWRHLPIRKRRPCGALAAVMASCGCCISSISTSFADNPKIFVGFSDITALHIPIQKRTGLITFHGPNLQDGFGKPDDMPTANQTALWRMLHGRSAIGRSRAVTSMISATLRTFAANDSTAVPRLANSRAAIWRCSTARWERRTRSIPPAESCSSKM